MPAELDAILKIEVPVIVQIGARDMTVLEVMNFKPGAIVELPKAANEELDVLVSNKQIGNGAAVKVGENFGVRITYVGDLHLRIRALAGDARANDEGSDAFDAEALAEQLLAGS